MSFIETEADPKALLHRQIGAASPLWALFTGAAVTGAAWWWMSRWANPQNLEAMFSQGVRSTEKSTEQLKAEILAMKTPMLEAPAAFAKAAISEVEPAAEALIETPVAMADAAEEIVAQTAPAVDAVAAPATDLAVAMMEGAPVAAADLASEVEAKVETAVAVAKKKIAPKDA